MITVTFTKPGRNFFNRKRTVYIPEKWSELTAEQFVDTARVLHFMGKRHSLTEVKLLLLKRYINYNRTIEFRNADELEEINNKLYILADMIRFPFKPLLQESEYLDVLSHELRNELQHTLVKDITNPDYLAQLEMINGQVVQDVAVNLPTDGNVFSKIYIKKHQFTGYEFKRDNHGVTLCNLSTDRFIYAYDFMSLYHESKDDAYLYALASMLFIPSGSTFEFYKCYELKEVFERESDIAYAIYMQFHALAEFIFTVPKYEGLFCSGETEQNKIHQGFISVIDSLAKDGYASRSELLSMDVFSAFDLMVKQLADAVASLRSQDLTYGEISQRLKLPINYIKQL